MKLARSLQIPVVLLLLVAASYATAVGGRFVYDDLDLLAGNDLLLRFAAGEPAPDGSSCARRMLTADFARTTDRGDGLLALAPLNYYRPVVVLSYLFDTFFWSEMGPAPVAAPGEAEEEDTPANRVRMNPVGFHLTNLLFHALNAILVFRLALGLARDRRVAAVAAAIYAVHPIHTESVAWISGRTDVIAATFFLSALWAYLRFRRTGRWLPYGVAVLLFGVGLFAKEMIASLGLVLLLIEALDHRFSWIRRAGARPGPIARYAAVAPFFALIGAYLLTKSSFTGTVDDESRWADVGFVTALFSLFRAGFWYLGKWFVPASHDLYPILGFAGAGVGLAFLLGHLAIAAGAALAVWRRRALLLGFGVLAFYLALAPVSSVLPGTRLLRFGEDIEFPVSERFLYLPSIFLSLALAWLLVALGRRGGSLARVGVGIVLLALVTGGAVRSACRGLEWRTNLDLYAAAVETSPASVRMQTNLGIEYLKAFRLPKAKRAFFTSLRLQEEHYARQGRRHSPDPQAYQHLGRCYLMEGEYRVGIDYYGKGYSVAPDLPMTAHNFGFAATVVGAIFLDRALAENSYRAYRLVVERAPGFALAHERAEFMKNVVGAWQFYLGGKERGDRMESLFVRSLFHIANNCMQVADDPRPVHALEVIRSARRMVPHADAKSRPLTARELAALDELHRRVVEQGRAYYAHQLAVGGDRPILHYLIGAVERWEWVRSGDEAVREKAEAHLGRALEGAPDLGAAARALAAILTASGRSEEAIRVVERSALARMRTGMLLWHESAYRTAFEAWKECGGGRPGPWRDMLARVLDAVAARLEAEAGSHAFTWNSLGYIHYQRARHLGVPAAYEEARRCFARALELDPELVNAAGSLVDTLRRLGRTEEAEEQRRIFRTRFPRHPFFRD